MNMRTQIFGAMLMAVVLFTMGVLATYYFVSRQSIAEASVAALEEFADIAQAGVEALVIAQRERLRGVRTRTQMRISFAKFIDSGDLAARQKVEKIIGDALGSIDDFRSIALRDLRGAVRIATDQQLPTDVLPEAVRIRAMREEMVRVRELAPEQWELQLLGPLILDDATVGIVDIRSDLRPIAGFAESYLRDTGSLDVLLAYEDQDGSAVFFTNRRYGRSAAALPRIAPGRTNVPITRALQQQEVTLTDGIDYRGEPVYSVTRYIPGVHWGLVVKRDQREVQAELRQHLYPLLYAVGAFLLLVVLCALWFAGLLTRSMRDLTEVAERVGAGDLSMQFSRKFDGRNEVGQLAHTMQRMVNNLVKLSLVRDDLEARAEVLRQSEQRHKSLAQEAREARDALAQANAELERANGDLQAFASTASHDMQAPVRKVQSYIELLREELGSELDNNARQYVSVIERSAQRLERLIQDLLSFHRAGSSELQMRELDCTQMIVDVQSDLETVIVERQAVIDVGTMPESLHASPVLSHVFANLLRNGMKYCPDDRVPHLRVSAEHCDGVWQFSVQDNGIGIAEEHHHRIFEPFRRLHTNQEYTGSGVGLSVCQRIIERHGGRIWLESQEGVGSTFFFTIADPSDGDESTSA